MAIEFNTIEETKGLPPVNDLGLDLGDYSEAKNETPLASESPAETEPINTETVNSELPPANPENWKGDPRYYQRGEKKGTLRDKPYIKANYNHAATTTIPGSMLINGALFLMFINFIIPLIIVTTNNWLSPKEKMSVKDIRLTKEECKDIDPLMDATLKQLNIQANPWILLMLSLTAAYATKFVNRKMEIGIENALPKENTNQQ